jgi:hypothetical protein
VRLQAVQRHLLLSLTPLGQCTCGHSGSTSGPHLHAHAIVEEFAYSREPMGERIQSTHHTTSLSCPCLPVPTVPPTPSAHPLVVAALARPPMPPHTATPATRLYSTSAPPSAARPAVSHVTLLCPHSPAQIVEAYMIPRICQFLSMLITSCAACILQIIASCRLNLHMPQQGAPSSTLACARASTACQRGARRRRCSCSSRQGGTWKVPRSCSMQTAAAVRAQSVTGAGSGGAGVFGTQRRLRCEMHPAGAGG